MKTTGEEPAYPTLEQNGNDMWSTYPGLTIRQQAILDFMAARIAGMSAYGMYGSQSDAEIAKDAAAFADAFIAELNK